MKKIFSVSSILCACLFSVTAFSAQSLDENFSPALTFGFQFDDSSNVNSPGRFSAQFNLRSPFLRFDGSAQNRNLSSPSPHPFIEGGNFNPYTLPIFQTTFGSNGFDGAKVLGREMFDAANKLNAAEGGAEESSHSWLWWAAGGVVAAAGIGLAASGGKHNDDTGSSTPPSASNGRGGIGCTSSGCVVPCGSTGAFNGC